MTNNVKMHTSGLGQCNNDVIRVKSGYLPQVTNSLGNMLHGYVVQFVKDGTTDEVAIVRDYETYGEPSGGIYAPFTKIAVHHDGKKERYNFEGKNGELTAKIDFEKIAPESRELVKMAEEAIRQSKELSKTPKTRDGGETIEVLSELPEKSAPVSRVSVPTKKSPFSKFLSRFTR